MNRHLGVSEAVSLLERLRETAHDFAAREEKLNADFRAQSSAQLRAFETESARREEALSEATAAEQEAFEGARERCEKRFEQRKRRISQGHLASRNRATEAIRQQEGRRKYKVQEGTLNAERRRERELADSAAAREQFEAALAANLQVHQQLEGSALRAFRGYRAFRKRLAPHQAPTGEVPADHAQLLGRLEELHSGLGDRLRRFRRLWLVQIGRFFPIWFLVLIGLAGAAAFWPAARPLLGAGLPAKNIGLGLMAFAVVMGLTRIAALKSGAAAAALIADELGRAQHWQGLASEKAAQFFQQEQQRIQNDYQSTTRQLDEEWRLAVRTAIEMLDVRPRQIDEQAQRAMKKNENLHAAQLKKIERDHAEAAARLRRETEATDRQAADLHRSALGRIEAQHAAKWAGLEAEWKQRTGPILESIQAANEEARRLFPEWQDGAWKDWQPPRAFENAARFGRLEVDTAQFLEAAPADPRLALPVRNFSVPLLLTYPDQGSILFETREAAGAAQALETINDVIFRLLATTPPGKLSFTIFDPVGLGQNFAALMHLADYEENIVSSRIWTQQNQFEEKLAELNEHMEKVIQMYLRNEYETIAEYNAQAGTIAEKYHVLVIASFPVNFSDTAARRLRNIATSGARCGVYTLIQWDQRNALPPDFVPDELRKNSVSLARRENGFALANWRAAGTRVVLDPPPSPEFATEFLHRVGESGRGASRVEVPFEQVAPAEAEIWSEETTEELRVPIGRSGATKLQYLEIGKATRQHGLIAGKTGSGKSTLFHVIITNLALWCSPEQVEFYLVDFKKGVEFKCYASRKLPHARVVAIESDRQFGLSVLERIDAELRRRGDLFRQLGVQDLPGYKRAGGTEPMPRTLLMIDEFQEFFTEEDRVSQGAAVLLDRIVRQGRAFGIHVLLGSQTLGGAYTLARATIGQMVIRIALQCNEADAYLIMDQDNPAPRLLSRPGEGIYNDAAGAIEGNSPFQAVWLSENTRDQCLAKIRGRADAKRYPGPFVFEGNAPADVRDNELLNGLLARAPAAKTPAPARTWLGAPNSIKGPTEAAFQRQGGSNLLVVGQNEEASLTMLAVALVSLGAQYPPGAARFILLDSTAPESAERDFLDRAVAAVSHGVTRVRGGDIAETMSGLAEELKRRSEASETPAAPGAGAAAECFLLIHGLQNYKRLRQEDEFSFSATEAASPAAALLGLITDGPAHGIHILMTCDSFNNVSRFLGRKNLAEFELRVLFQMSASDSASLIDAPDAASLGLNRALLYNDREGYLETFRPYARPGNEWFEAAARALGPKA